MLLARQDKANKVIKEIENRTNKVGCFGRMKKRNEKYNLKVRDKLTQKIQQVETYGYRKT